MTSQAYNNNDVLLFPLQIWKQPQQIKCSDQFTVHKWDISSFEHLHEENTKPLVNVSVLPARPQVFYDFYRKEKEEWQNSNRTGQGCWCSCDCVSSHHILVEKSVVEHRTSEAAMLGWY